MSDSNKNDQNSKIKPGDSKKPMDKPRGDLLPLSVSPQKRPLTSTASDPSNEGKLSATGNLQTDKPAEKKK
jgi:hypothetical protein